MYGLSTLFTRSAFKSILCPGLLGGLISMCDGVKAAEDVQFNTDILDLNDRSNFDLSQFSRSGFILPGAYPMAIQVNTETFSEQMVAFYPPEDDPKGSQACLSPQLVEQLGLKKEFVNQLVWWKEGECLATGSLPGMEVTGDLSSATLRISLPQAYLEYSAPNWDPPSRWDEGVSGLLLDYNLTGQSIHQRHDSTRNTLTGNGTVGANAGA